VKVLVTGANGFFGKNLGRHLAERDDIELVPYTRTNQLEQLPGMLHEVDFVFHLAGVNRPQDPAEFISGNIDLTVALCQGLADVALTSGRKVPVVFSSSTQAALDNSYGASKRAAEDCLFTLNREHGVPVYVLRLPNVFGKWCRPNYNSVVATFCYNISRGLPIHVKDPQAALTLVYIDNVIERFVQLMDGAALMLGDDGFVTVQPQEVITVGELARLIRTFHESRKSLMTERVGTGLMRALYATYVSYLPVEAFIYDLPCHSDYRGVFVEMLKTPDCGQFSFFTILHGLTRGGHYHHSKTEKFLVIKGLALFQFRHVETGQEHKLETSGCMPQVVETVPGWTHDITNIGEDELIVMLWANEIFDSKRPDTFDCPL